VIRNISDFKKELKALLTKHNIDISFCADDCSDWYGITDARMSICDSNTCEEIERFPGSDICATDL